MSRISKQPPPPIPDWFPPDEGEELLLNWDSAANYPPDPYLSYPSDLEMAATPAAKKTTAVSPAPAPPIPISTDPRHLLKQVFGYDDFRPLQAEIIQNILRQQDSLAIMPTGSGKSLCYQLPALLFPGLTIVVSPLISLMEDQVMQLREMGVTAVYLNSTLSYAEQAQIKQRIRQGQVKLLYVAPETLLRQDTLLLLQQTPVNCLTIDEAHCISEWGHEFRPEYRQLVEVRRRLPQAVCLAVTATATAQVRADIKNSLNIPDAAEFIASFNRENLFLGIETKTDPLAQTIAFLEAHRGEAGIIYCTTRRRVDDLATMLTRQKWPVLPYHAGLDDATRRQHQRRFMYEDGLIMVATVAFGMGIDKSNVRFILHVDLPKNLESYYQQIGRAGRDGLRADCLLLFSYSDVQTIQHFIQQESPPQQVAAQQRLSTLLQFTEATVCRRRPLLAYFGETFASKSCDLCDNCTRPPAEELVDVTIPAQKFLSCVKRTGELYGMAHIINVLRGSREKKVLEKGHDKLSTYNIGGEFSDKEWRHLARQFIQQELVQQDTQYGSLKLLPKAYAVFKGEKVSARLLPQPRPETAVSFTPHDPILFELLRQKRRTLAAAAKLPPYTIFSDPTLVEMATYLPHSPHSFARLYGVGEAKMAKYAPEFLPIIQAYCQEKGLKEKPKTAPSAPVPIMSRGTRTLEVLDMVNNGRSLAEIAQSFNIKLQTVIDHLWKAMQAGQNIPTLNLRSLSRLSPEVQQEVLEAFRVYGTQWLKPIYEALEETVSYDELHLLRLCTGQETPQTKPNWPTEEIRAVILACVRACPNELPRSGLAKLLVGSPSERVMAYQQVEEYGRFPQIPRFVVMQEIDTLLSTGQLVLTPQRHLALP